MRTVLACVAALAATGCGKSDSASKDKGAGGEPPRITLRVGAAASLTDAFAEIAAEYKAKTGVTIEVTQGSSGQLAAQIAEGAPFDLFASAAEKYVDEVIENGSAVRASRTVYAHGRVVIWTPPGTERPESLADLADPRFKKIAIAKPELAPYGRAAREALEHAGLWAQLEPRVVYGDNVAAVLQLVETGNAEVALTALSLVIDEDDRYIVVDDKTHGPLNQSIVITRACKQPDAARAFVDFLTSPEGRAILTKYGL